MYCALRTKSMKFTGGNLLAIIFDMTRGAPSKLNPEVKFWSKKGKNGRISYLENGLSEKLDL